MKAELWRASHTARTWIRDINSIEDIYGLLDEYKEPLIINYRDDQRSALDILIYDSHIE